MRRRAKPVKAWEKPSRGGVDAANTMENVIQPAFPDIQQAIAELDGTDEHAADPELKAEIKRLFDEGVPSMAESAGDATAGDVVLAATDFAELNMQMQFHVSAEE